MIGTKQMSDFKMYRPMLGIVAIIGLVTCFVSVSADASVVYYLNFNHGVQANGPQTYTQGIGETLSGATGASPKTPATSSLVTSTGPEGGQMYQSPGFGVVPTILSGYKLTGGPTINTGSYTIEMLINPTSFSNLSYLSRDIGTNRSQFLLTSQGTLEFDSFTGNAAKVVGATILNADTWYHVAATFDGSDKTMRVYVNGGLDGATVDFSSVSEITSSFNIFTGAGVSFGRDFFGSVDAFAISDEALEAGSFVLAAVPEPASIALMGLGGLLMLRRRRA